MRLIAKARKCPQILNDNLDKLSRTFLITHRGIGNASISIHASSQDPIYNMAHMMHAVKVSSEPGLILSPESAVIQYRQSKTFALWPQTRPSSDVLLRVSVITSEAQTNFLMPDLIASVSPESSLLLRKDDLSAGNSRSVTVTCLGPAGTVRLLFQGSLPSALPFSEAQETNNYDRMMHAAVSVSACLALRWVWERMCISRWQSLHL